MKTTLCVLILLALASAASFAQDAATAVTWKLPSGNKSTLVGAKLTISPADAPWDKVAAIGAVPVLIWNNEGATVHVKMSFRATSESARDIITFIGFTSTGKADTYQGAENVVGLYLNYSKKTHRLYASLARKEKNGDNEAIRGGEWGDLAAYTPSEFEIPIENDAADVTLSVNEETVSASVAGSQYSRSVPNGLTAAFWKRAFLLAQCMNNNEGRGSVTLEVTSLAAKPGPVGDQYEMDYKRRPPDMDKIPDQVFLRSPKTFGPDAFSVAGSSTVGDGGTPLLAQKGYAGFIKSFGGISRFPYGLEISFYFWPYEAKDWVPVLGKKGGEYGTIERWYYPNYKNSAEKTLSYQTMLAAYKKRGLKLILLFNTHAMFDGHDFVYVKTLPEDRMKTSNPLEGGTFNRANLRKIVANNETLVDYVIKNGYTDTVAYWEMDNERWDMKGGEYAECVAAHVKMLRSKLPKAKVIVCLGELGVYSRNAEQEHSIAWSHDVLTGLREAGLQNDIDCFAPHLYPFLFDKADEITSNQLEDWSVRNTYRSLDYLSGLLEAQGFTKSKFYVSEWGVQSDGLENHNELITSMASAIATVREMMTIYSHPRVVGSTWHQFFHASYVSKARNMPINQWGEQTVFVTDEDRYITTPPSEALRMFVSFAKGARLVPVSLAVPKGVHVLCANDAKGKKYFVVNATANEVKFPAPGVSGRTTLSAADPTATSILKYGTFGDGPGEVHEIVPRFYPDAILPPYSVSTLR